MKQKSREDAFMVNSKVNIFVGYQQYTDRSFFEVFPFSVAASML